MNIPLTAHPVARHRLPASSCFFGRGDPADVEIVFYVWVVRGDGFVGLIDAGLPGGDDLAALRTTGPYTDVVGLSDVLATEGLRPEDVDWCALTQLVTYHTGGLTAANLPRATTHLARAGLLEFIDGPPGHPPPEFYFTDASWSHLRRLAVERRLRAHNEPALIAPGVEFHPTGGHHPGSAGLRIRAADGLVGILETAFLPENIELDIPVGLAEDAAACRAAITTWKAECDVVLAGHDPALAERYRR